MLTRELGYANKGGVRYYALDNEPVWWSYVHRDIETNASSYDSILNRGIVYAKVVKRADSTALVTGPVCGGWSDVFYSNKDMQVRTEQSRTNKLLVYVQYSSLPSLPLHRIPFREESSYCFCDCCLCFWMPWVWVRMQYDTEKMQWLDRKVIGTVYPLLLRVIWVSRVGGGPGPGSIGATRSTGMRTGESRFCSTTWSR